MPVQFREGGLAEVRLWRGAENCPLEEPTVQITDKAEVECSGLEPGTKYFVKARRGESSFLTCRAAPRAWHGTAWEASTLPLHDLLADDSWTAPSPAQLRDQLACLLNPLSIPGC